MDDTTRRDVIPPNFDSPSWVAASPIGSRADAPTRPTNAAAYDRPTGATSSRPLPAGDATSGVQMTYASKLPPNHPGLQLERPQPRTLRKGPILTSVTIVSVFVGIALIVALSPKTDRAKAATPDLPDSPNKEIALPDSVRDAPGNNAELQKGPRLRGTSQPAAPASGYSGASRENLRQSLREERAKALGSPILVEVENPTLGDQGVQPPPQGAAAMANALAAGGVAATGTSTLATSALANMGAGIVDPNMQQHKNDFLSRDGEDNKTYVSQSMAMPRSPFEVKAGTIIPTTLITGINSDLPGQIVGQVRENVYDTVTGNHLLIPQGSRLMATYDSSVTFGQSRVLVCWNRVIRPDGVSIALECMPGVDLAGYAGFADEVDNHWFRIITGVALGTLVSATAQRSQGDVSGYNPTIPQLWAANAGGAINQAGQAITQKNLAIQPTIKVRPGFTVNVLVTKDIVLVPYNR